MRIQCPSQELKLLDPYTGRDVLVVILMNFWRLSVLNCESTQFLGCAVLRGTPHFFELYLQEPHQFVMVGSKIQGSG